MKFIIDTETHPDHSYGHWLFPSAVIINAQGAGDEMRQSFDAKHMADLDKSSPEMHAALEGFGLIPPQIEYGDKMVLHVGERTFMLDNLDDAQPGEHGGVAAKRERRCLPRPLR